MNGLIVEQPGPRTTVQDTGRTGFQHQGLSPGGAADLRCFRWANHLLDNPDDAACLEVTLGGLVAEAGMPLTLALTGADCRATLNGARIGNWCVFAMASGDRLQLQTPAEGLLTYLAVVGGWQTRSFCGSRSAVARERLRGLGAIGPGDTIPASSTTLSAVPDALLRRSLPAELQPALAARRPLKLIPGPDLHTFDAIDTARFIHTRYRISQQSDRMGYRLEGPALHSPGGVTSRGVHCGTVQVPGDGQPMVMLNDRQTIGGYPVIGTVPVLDCSRLAQCRPGDEVCFSWSNVAECQGGRMVFEHQMRTLAWTTDGRLTRRDSAANA